MSRYTKEVSSGILSRGRNDAFQAKGSAWLILLSIALFTSCGVEARNLLRNHGRSQARTRWEAPCMAPRERITDVHDQQLVSNSRGRPTLGLLIRNIADMAISLSGKLAALKNIYAEKRFNDTELVSDLESHMFQLTGRPKHRATPRETSNIHEIMNIIRISAEDVARMVAYWEMAEDGERFDEPGETFETQFSGIASDPQCGLYWMLCHMHLILEEFEVPPYSTKTASDIKSIQQNEVAHSRAARHWRDYLVMVYLHKVLQTVKGEMQIAYNSLLQ